MSKRKYLAIFSFAFIFAIMVSISMSMVSISMGTERFDSNYAKYDYLIAQNECQTSPSPLTQTTSSNINKLEIKEIEGTAVIGKLEIPKIDLATYILSDTTKETLNKSITKLCGPKVNGVGNLCITGHNYHNNRMFGDLKDLDINDKIYITGTKGDKIEYVVYAIDKVYPKEIQCLSQDTQGERQITLITCTTGAIKRLIVKATEVYD